MGKYIEFPAQQWYNVVTVTDKGSYSYPDCRFGNYNYEREFMKMKKLKKVLALTAVLALSTSSAYALTTNEFDAGMAKGINYFNQGLYYEARDEFQWFCDSNWGAMNPGQQQYALDYLDGAKRGIQNWEQYVLAQSRRMTKDKAISLVKDVIGSEEQYLLGYVYSAYDKGNYYLVNAKVTRNADGIAKYRVYKDSHYVEFIGVGSEWGFDSYEYNPYYY